MASGEVTITIDGDASRVVRELQLVERKLAALAHSESLRQVVEATAELNAAMDNVRALLDSAERNASR